MANAADRQWMEQTDHLCGIIGCLAGASTDDRTFTMWIDNDSTEGVFNIKAIADEIGIKPCFTVIADRTGPIVADSLASWQPQGAEIVLCGLSHVR